MNNLSQHYDLITYSALDVRAQTAIFLIQMVIIVAWDAALINGWGNPNRFLSIAGQPSAITKHKKGSALPIDNTRDYHMHSVYSDGKASIDAMARSAAGKRLTQVTLTDHMPLPFETRYAMPRAKVEAYRREIRQAQTRHTGGLDIKSGMEFEYIPRHHEWIHQLWKMGWDHCIVSVHGNASLRSAR